MNITFCGVNVTTVPDQFKRVQPQGRFNYIDIPWNASCPSHGVLLVTANQLNGIINNGSRGDLVLIAGDDVVTLKNIFCVKAMPIFGEYFQPDPNTHEGLFALEIQDYRSVKSMEFSLQKTINVQTYPYKGKTFLQGSVRDSDHKPYELSEIITKLTQNLGISLPLPAGISKYTPWDIHLNCPVLIGLDLLFNALVVGKVIKYDPTTDSPDLVLGLADLNTDVNFLLNKYLKNRIFGGKGIVFTPVNMAGSYKVVPSPEWAGGGDTAEPAVPEGSTGDALGTKIEFVGIPIVRKDQDSDEGIDRKTAHNRARNPNKSIYHGFIKEFLETQYPFSLVTFDWSEFPTTSIHLTNSTPIRTLLEGPHWRFLKDLPTKVSFNGSIQADLPREGFYAVIVECYQNGWAGVKKVSGPQSVTPEEGTAIVHVWNGLEPWHETGETVACVWLGTSCVIMDKIRGIGTFQFPNDANLSPGQAQVTTRAYCQDTPPTGGMP